MDGIKMQIQIQHQSSKSTPSRSSQPHQSYDKLINGEFDISRVSMAEISDIIAKEYKLVPESSICIQFYD